MAHLISQLNLPVDLQIAVLLLYHVATPALSEVPQPAYIYTAFLVLSEFSHIYILPQLFISFIPTGSSLRQEGRRYPKRAA
jgi:hypothetical protein